MGRQYRFHLIGLVVGLVFSGVLATSEIPEFPLVKRIIGQEGTLLPQGTPAPDFILPTVQGKILSIDQLRGKPAVLIFTSTTCEACDELKAELLKLKSADLQNHLVFMQGKDDPQALSSEGQQLEEQIGKRFPVAQDTAKSVFHAYKISMVPTTYQIDEKGKIRSSAIGVSRCLELVQEVAAEIISTSRPAGKG